MRNLIDAAIVFAISLILFYAAAWAQTYTVTDLGAFQPSAIAGPWVVGSENGLPVRINIDSGEKIILGHRGHGGVANAVLATGEAVGTIKVPGTSGLTDAATFWDAQGQFWLLSGPLPSYATAINDAWIIAGHSPSCVGGQQAVRWWFGREECLVNDRPRNEPAQGVGVDRWHRVWGSTGRLHEWQMRVWDVDGSVIVPPGLYNHSHRILAVNKDGVATGEYENFSPGASHATAALRVTMAEAIELPRLGGDTRECTGISINAHGDIGGFCVSLAYAGRTGRAVLWPASGGIIDLSRTIVLPEGRQLGLVRGVADDGTLIVLAGPSGGFGYDRQYLLTPVVSEPAAVALQMNSTSFSVGETLSVSVERAGLGDLHVAVILPDGVTTLFLTNMDALSYIVSTIERGPYPVTAGQSISHTWHNLNEPGTYHIVAALSRPGSLADGVISDGDIVALDWKALQFVPQVASR
jgi:hypothetical protein